MANGLQGVVTNLIRRLSDRPAFRIYGKATYEPDWHIIDVFATGRRNWNSHWPLWRGQCTTLTSQAIGVGWDFAFRLIVELKDRLITQDSPQIVIGKRLRDPARRLAAGGTAQFSALDLMAHECGHIAQARRFGLLYWPIGAAFTLFREGPHWWQQFENEASETGQFGGIVPGTLHQRLAEL